MPPTSTLTLRRWLSALGRGFMVELPLTVGNVTYLRGSQFFWDEDGKLVVVDEENDGA